jgi:hemerythrin-like domain-containing protein
MLRDPALVPLSRQHHDALALCVLTRRSLQEDPSSANIVALTQRAIEFHELELTHHFEIEEQTLFPAIGSTLGSLPLIDELIADHRNVEAIIVQMGIQPGDSLLAEFTGLLSRHIRREESELFEDIQRRLSPEVLQRLATEIDAKAMRVCHRPLL